MRTLPHVDRVGVAERVAALGKRSIKGDAKRQGLLLAISMLDLTTLEGADTPGKVQPAGGQGGDAVAGVAGGAVVRGGLRLPDDGAVARDAVAGYGVHVASVATGFPAGQTPLATRLEEVRLAVADGADEIDMVISRDAYLRGDDAQVAWSEIEAIKDACGPAHLKVILETAELGSSTTSGTRRCSRWTRARTSSRPRRARRPAAARRRRRSW